MAYLPEGITRDRICRACESDEMIGFCLECGAEADHDVEPDATEYHCNECKELSVYGAQEILMMVYDWDSREYTH